ncbi:MAG: hypothetical protein K8S55_05845 [Phycisphaerae bacterium]|nr:hypothetical protein [Phycisphaerae bacterium]
MKILVVYYSRTGVTRKVASSIAQTLNADIEELIDTKKRAGPLGFAVAVKDAALKKIVPITPPQKNPGDYDLVIIGTPVWADTMCTAVRAYLTDCGKDIKQAASFCTTHTSGIEQANRQIADIIAGKTIAAAGFRQKHVKRDEHIPVLDAFLEQIREPQGGKDTSAVE